MPHYDHIIQKKGSGLHGATTQILFIELDDGNGELGLQLPAFLTLRCLPGSTNNNLIQAAYALKDGADFSFFLQKKRNDRAATVTGAIPQ